MILGPSWVELAFDMPSVPNPIPPEPWSQCSVPGCRERTHERKPYCLTHLDKMTHAAAILRELARREAELIAAARSWENVDLNGSRAQEILGLLRIRGETTLRRLYQEVAKDEHKKRLVHRGLPGYLEALKRANLIVMYERYTDHGLMTFVKLKTIVVKDPRP